MSEWMGYLNRATGIVAAVLCVAALVWGLFFSARNTGTKLKPNWWLALHNYLGGMALAFIGLHMFFTFLDSRYGFGFVQLFVPGGTIGWAYGFGIIAAWLFAIVVLPSMAKVRRRLPRKAWHAVHLLSIPAVVLTGVHAYQAGSDSLSAYFTRGLALMVGLAVYPISIRLMGIAQRHRAAA